jgi:hypothetical protein
MYDGCLAVPARDFASGVNLVHRGSMLHCRAIPAEHRFRADVVQYDVECSGGVSDGNMPVLRDINIRLSWLCDNSFELAALPSHISPS